MSDDVVNDNPRIVVIDDNEAIHDDFLKTLAKRENSAELDADETFLFGTTHRKAQTKFRLKWSLHFRDATASKWSKPSSKRGGPTPWHSLTCECPLAGTASKRSSTCGGLILGCGS